MPSPLAFLPLATTAASLGAGVAQRVAQGLLAGGSSFADSLAAAMNGSSEKAPAANESANPASSDSLSDLIDQLRTQLMSKLQSLGISTDETLKLHCRAAGEIDVEGDSDSAALIEQLLQSDAGLRDAVTNLYQSFATNNPGEELVLQL
jgi:hypothetical protein